ncbi:hypothetical protein LAZ67_2005513 [Cordylochernes scorpioides]|uniref:Reverse transcriptase domain-containing protein n=1 Tax=Cordylochernes scorpioides TaxID=51811 RepID=A0ABY6K4M1_9ARAC|nr:hypothetical protein LAZ67_2005513 [Cordylochernes scorpioides]
MAAKNHLIRACSHCSTARAPPGAEEVYRYLLPRDIATTDQFIAECRRVVALQGRRVTASKFERLPNVTSLGDLGDVTDLQSLIRQIVREEVQRALAPPREEPRISSLEEIVKEEVDKVLAPMSGINTFPMESAARTPGIQPDSEKVEAIKKFPVPKSVCDIQSYLGLCSYYRRFIKNFSKIAAPLQILLKKDQKFIWTQEQKDSFESLKKALMQKEVDTMLERKVIQPSESPWSAPVVLVKKKDGTWRFCVDFRRLNHITKKDVYPLPRIDDVLDHLSSARYYSTMDLKTGYWQVEVDERDREKTAFVTPDGLYELMVMPFGLCNAPATFERMMDNVLMGLKWNICLCYLDDIVVYSDTFEEHLERLSKVLSCLQQAGLTINPDKCLFGSTRIKILGHVVDKDDIRQNAVPIPLLGVHIHGEHVTQGLIQPLCQSVCLRVISRGEQVAYLATGIGLASLGQNHGSKIRWFIVHSVLTFCATSIDNQLRKFWELDSIPPCTQPILTKEEIRLTTTGRYQVRLSFRVTPNFGNSKRVAFRRFHYLKNNRYKPFMKEYSSLNHMQIISAIPSQVYYMPHHCVLKEESTTTNLRVVFDASACSNDSPSLNKGPKLQTDIFDLLLRKILIHPDDSDYQRVLWRDSASDAIQEYKLTTITYGTACAPYLAIRTWHQLANDEAMNYPVASEIVKRDFYVDDLLTGADTLKEVFPLGNGFLTVQKYLTSYLKIKRALINPLISSLPSVKLLGILVKPPYIQVYSKRSLLSLIVIIYDRLGWMAPLVIIFKTMLQNLWAKGCNWDERLPEYIPCRNSILTLELHGFCDSSGNAYAAVIYVKSCKHDGSVKISLIASKTKAAPIKVLSLPRLELCSALLLANLFVAVKESLSLHFDQIFLVSAIQRKTPPHSWFHVPGSENPADLATRGLTPAQLVDNQLWWHGPHWLQDPLVNSYIDLSPSDELSTFSSNLYIRV